MTRRTSLLFALTVGLLCVAGWVVLRSPRVAPSSRVSRAAPLTLVRFGVLPYLDHTYAIVGKELGFFEDVGIDLQIRELPVEQIVPALANRTVDVCSTPPGILMAAWDSAPNLVTFVFGNMFTGYAIMAQPSGNYRSFSELVAQGSAADAAAVIAISQMKGKSFAYPPEDAIRPFIDLALARARLTVKDLKTVVLDDPLTVNAMRKGTVDFQTGGAPSRISLQFEGFRPIFTSADLISFARPSADSVELAGVLQNGWATTKEKYESDRDLMMRLASVNYRIMEALQKPGEARRIHLRYLARLQGRAPYGPSEERVFYEDLNQFRDFDYQRRWFHDKTLTEYYAYINGAILRTWTDRQGYYKRRPPTVEDVIFADDTYTSLEAAKDKCLRMRDAARARAAHGSEGLRAAVAAAEDAFRRFDFSTAERLFEGLPAR
jgi:ABC-type nitrate/sulfonate/bicarbonate transport system substrate-binding protein